jgi:hypothetical protein
MEATLFAWPRPSVTKSSLGAPLQRRKVTKKCDAG